MNRFAPGERTPSGGRDRPPRRSRAGEPVAPNRRRVRAGSGPAGSGTGGRSQPGTPATVWTVDPAPGDLSGVWPLTVVDRCVSSFSDPGARVLLLPSPAPHPVPPDSADMVLDTTLSAALEAVRRSGRAAAVADPGFPDRPDTSSALRPPLPYWADVFHTAPPATPPADTTSAAVTTVESGGPHPGDRAERRVADLVIASVGPDTPLDDLFGLACARLLRTGGILVVLTHSDWTQGRLVDPTGPIVATAQNADLLYLQHIVVIHARVCDGEVVLDADSPLAEDEQRGRHRAAVRGLPAPHRRIHTDLLVFAQPRDHDPTPASPATTAFETGVIR